MSYKLLFYFLQSFSTHFSMRMSLAIQFKKTRLRKKIPSPPIYKNKSTTAPTFTSTQLIHYISDPETPFLSDTPAPYDFFTPATTYHRLRTASSQLGGGPRP